MSVKNKPRVYIAGPISQGDLTNNVRRSDDAFILLTRAGFACLNPMWSVYAGSAERGTMVLRQFGYDAVVPDTDVVLARGTRTSSLPLTAEDWYGLDLPWVEVAHAVLRLPGESRGADGEVAHAEKFGIPVFHSVQELISHFEQKVRQ